MVAIFLHILEVVPDIRSLDERNYLCHRILFTVGWTNLDPAREQHGEMEKEERESSYIQETIL